jgi:DNA ligase D-like protein (predicted 3'-phosphoesterase)
MEIMRAGSRQTRASAGALQVAAVHDPQHRADTARQHSRSAHRRGGTLLDGRTAGTGRRLGPILISLRYHVGHLAPPRDVPSRPEAIFVVQKHTAQRAGLHWDFRLEHGGVLWSWAVPKGPSLDPADRRMAIQVEDHPVDYAEFQGTIAEGEYGAGSVKIWDRGIWQPLEDPDECMRKGTLRFTLPGQHLAGRFTLARLHRRDLRNPDA